MPMLICRFLFRCSLAAEIARRWHRPASNDSAAFTRTLRAWAPTPQRQSCACNLECSLAA